MAEVEVDEDEAKRLIARLFRKADREDGPAPEPKVGDMPASAKVKSANAIDARVAWFKERYPDGFEGEKWKKEIRSSDDPHQQAPPRSHHRHAAREQLKAELSDLELGTAFAEICCDTDLLSPKTGPGARGPARSPT